jgi:hypothetical protein
VLPTLAVEPPESGRGQLAFSTWPAPDRKALTKGGEADRLPLPTHQSRKGGLSTSL